MNVPQNKLAIVRGCQFHALQNHDFLAALILAQRAFCAAAIFARPAALILLFFFVALTVEVVAEGAGASRIAFSSFSRRAIFSLRLAA
jgi:hypothetical protein